jgi:small subunit ribosomal protein S16
MAVKIRLSRIGKKKAPFYRIVAVDGRKKRDGQCLENLGTYNPLNGEIIQFHAERLKDWISKGAIPSDTVIRITKQFENGKTALQAKKATPKPAPAPKVEAPAKEEKVEAKAEEAAK